MRSRLEVGDTRNVDAGKVPQDFLRPESDLSDLLQPMKIYETLLQVSPKSELSDLLQPIICSKIIFNSFPYVLFVSVVCCCKIIML